MTRRALVPGLIGPRITGAGSINQKQNRVRSAENVMCPICAHPGHAKRPDSAFPLVRALVMVSRPVGGVLSRSPSPGSPWVTIHLCGPPWDCSVGAGRSARVPCLTLLRVGVASCRDRSQHWCALTAPFHPCLCVGPGTSAIGGLFSVARSDRLPRPGSRQHSDRWSPDLPRSVTVAGPTAATRPTHHRVQSRRRLCQRQPESSHIAAEATSGKHRRARGTCSWMTAFSPPTEHDVDGRR